MMPKRSVAVRVACLAVLGLVAGCSTIDSGAHFDETTDFSAWETWSWIADEPHIAPAGVDEFSPLTHRKIREAIAGELRLKGYRFVEDREQADFVVSYSLGSREELRVSSYPPPFSGPWGWHIAGSRYYVREYKEHAYEEGTLSVDVFDAESKQPVWHGWAAKTITGYDRDHPGEVIERGVARLFETWPRSAAYRGVDDDF